MSRSVRSVTVIPASINPISHLPIALQRKRRVAGYARVSTDSEEQQTSYEAQVDYYTRYIQSKPDWEFVKVYTDATVIIGLKQNPTIGRRFSPIFSFIEHLSGKSYRHNSVQLGQNFSLVCQPAS